MSKFGKCFKCVAPAVAPCGERPDWVCKEHYVGDNFELTLAVTKLEALREAVREVLDGIDIWKAKTVQVYCPFCEQYFWYEHLADCPIQKLKDSIKSEGE